MGFTGIANQAFGPLKKMPWEGLTYDERLARTVRPNSLQQFEESSEIQSHRSRVDFIAQHMPAGYVDSMVSVEPVPDEDEYMD